VRNQIRRLSATEAARDFSRLLDEVEAGTPAIIERRSRPVALIIPAEIGPRRISDCLTARLARPSATLDRRFGSDLKQIVRGHPAGEPPAWD